LIADKRLECAAGERFRSGTRMYFHKVVWPQKMLGALLSVFVQDDRVRVDLDRKDFFKHSVCCALFTGEEKALIGDHKIATVYVGQFVTRR